MDFLWPFAYVRLYILRYTYSEEIAAKVFEADVDSNTSTFHTLKVMQAADRLVILVVRYLK